MPDNQGFEEAALQRISQQLEPMADAAAGVMGMPPGGQKYSTDDQLALWNYSPIANPQVRIEAMLELKQLGKTDEEITDAIYPERRKLITTSRPTISGQLQFAREMDRLMDKKSSEMSMQAPTMLDQPMEAGPSMAAPAPPDPVQSFAPEIEPTSAQPSILDQPFSMGAVS